MKLKNVFVAVLMAIYFISFVAVTVWAQESVCSFMVAPQNLAFDAGGGSADVTVTASGQECAFTAASKYLWITVSPTQGKGSGTVRVTVGTNPSQLARFGSVTIAGKAVSVQLWQPKLSGGW